MSNKDRIAALEHQMKMADISASTRAKGVTDNAARLCAHERQIALSIQALDTQAGRINDNTRRINLYDEEIESHRREIDIHGCDIERIWGELEKLRAGPVETPEPKFKVGDLVWMRGHELEGDYPYLLCGKISHYSTHTKHWHGRVHPAITGGFARFARPATELYATAEAALESWREK